MPTVWSQQYYYQTIIIMLLLFTGLLSSVSKEEVITFKAYLGEYGMFLARQQSAEVSNESK